MSDGSTVKADAATPAPPKAQPAPQIPWSARPWLLPAYRQLLRQSDRPILVGPFRGEVGFEALYWIPWLERLRADLQIAPDRIIPVTRGGAGAWYHAPTWVELFELRDPKAIRLENFKDSQRTGWAKQYACRAFDRAVLRDAADSLGLKRPLTLHPAWMYHELRPFWEGQRGVAWLFDRTSYRPLSTLAIEGLTLPAEYVAVRFYFRPTFTPAQIEFARETIKGLAQHQHVVILTAGQTIDDHADYIPKDRTNVSVLSELGTVPLSTNLAIQAAVLAKAQGFVGTYGGFAQLALRFQRPVICFFEQWHSTAIAHRQVSEVLAQQMNLPFHVLQVGALPLLQQVCPRVQVLNAGNSPQDVGVPQAELVAQ